MSVRVVSPGGEVGLQRSPGFHQKLPMQPPKPCTGSHQKGWDLEGVEGATPHTSLTQLTFKTMSELNTQVQEDQASEALSDQDLEAVSGGLWQVIPIAHAIYEIHRATTR